MNVIEFAEKRMQACAESRDFENMNYWGAYLDGARAQKYESLGRNRENPLRGKEICPECKAVHAPTAPHNCFSTDYQKSFYEKNGRYPTWEDAMTHCPPDIKRVFRDELIRHGMDLTEEYKAINRLKDV